MAAVDALFKRVGLDKAVCKNCPHSPSWHEQEKNGAKIGGGCNFPGCECKPAHSLGAGGYMPSTRRSPSGRYAS